VKLSNYINSNYSNYKKSKCKIFFPKNTREIIGIINYAKKKDKKILTIGSGLSWFDTIYNTNQIIVNLNRYKKKFLFDKKNGILTISPGFKIKEILNKIKKYNWSLYSIPGGDNVSIGGCIGNDVHGKDSFKFGNFGENIIELDVILANEKIIKCSRTKNTKIFRSIIGGLGLIGIIINVKVRLKKISEIYQTDHYICSNYKDTVKNIFENNKDYDYINGWLDIYSKKDQLGKSVIFKSKKIKKNIYVKNKNLNTVNIVAKFQRIIFSFFVKRNLMKILNYFIFYLFKLKRKNLNTYQDITYPLSSYGVDIKDAIKPYSFFEIQVILKKKDLLNSLKNFILRCQKLKLNGFVIGIKIHKKNLNYLSFSDEGVSININQIFNNNDLEFNFKKLKSLHKYLITKKHKIYLCKDFLMDKKDINKNYVNFKKFLNVKKKVDPKEIFYSDFYKRIS
tara:strand:+ start:231 stop:1583 length:1353 start_codon:yes stop_codon:yes gene_type:complete